MLGARVILKEGLLPRYWLFLGAGITGAYLIAFPGPADISAPRLVPALLAVAAASLWAMGTVLGRRMSSKLDVPGITAWRFAFGLPVSWAIWGLQTRGTVSALSANDAAAVVLLATIPGLAAMLWYYQGLARVPGSTATIAELAFPVSATAINYWVFGAVLTASQWAGHFCPLAPSPSWACSACAT